MDTDLHLNAASALNQLAAEGADAAAASALAAVAASASAKRPLDDLALADHDDGDDDEEEEEVQDYQLVLVPVVPGGGGGVGGGGGGGGGRRDSVMFLPTYKVKWLVTDCGNRLVDAPVVVAANSASNAVLGSFDVSEEALERLRDHLLLVFSQTMSTVAHFAANAPGYGADVDAAIVDGYVHHLVARVAVTMPLLAAAEFLVMLYELLFVGGGAAGPPQNAASIMPFEFAVRLTPAEQGEYLLAVYAQVVRLYTDVAPTRAQLASVDTVRAFLQGKSMIGMPLYDLQQYVQVAWLFRAVPSLGPDTALIVQRRLAPLYYHSFSSTHHRRGASKAAAEGDNGVIDRIEAAIDMLDLEAIALGTAGAGAGAGERTSSAKSRAYIALERLVRKGIQEVGEQQTRQQLKASILQQMREWKGEAFVDAIEPHLRRFEAQQTNAILAPPFALAVLLELPRRVVESRPAFMTNSEHKAAAATPPAGKKRKTAAAQDDDDPAGAAAVTSAAPPPVVPRRFIMISVDSMNRYLKMLNSPKQLPRDSANTVVKMVENEVFVVLFGFLQGVLAGHTAQPTAKLAPDDIDRCYAYYLKR